jgi:hypothetical protein
MPHYADGTSAKVGDVVKGKGYNVKDEHGNLREIVGTVVHVTPGSTSCNVQVLHALQPLSPEDAKLTGLHSAFVLAGRLYSMNLEYGQCDHFTKIG